MGTERNEDVRTSGAQPEGSASSGGADHEPGTIDGTIDELFRQESEALSERRDKAGVGNGRARTRVGLALSGGGIRSATFCLGLLRGLAKTGALRRVDYLSTVSGGGYTGAAFGRLVSERTLDGAIDALVDCGSDPMRWLRRHGRYLAPTGARDFGAAAASYLRAWLAVHFEFAFVALLLGALVVAPHVLHNEFGVFEDARGTTWTSAWWLVALFVWCATVPGTVIAYWTAHSANGRDRIRTGWRTGVLVLATLAVLAGDVLVAIDFVGTLDNANRVLLPCLVVAACAGGIAGRLIGQLARSASSGDREAIERNRLTAATRRWNAVTLVLFGAGAFDALSWNMMHELATLTSSEGLAWLFGGLGVAGVALTVLRGAAGPLQQMLSAATASRRDWSSRLLNVGGMALMAALLLLWLTLIQWWVFESGAWVNGIESLNPHLADALRYLHQEEVVGRFAGLVVVGALWLLLTGANAQGANATSLHSFYRARLCRAWLAAANPQRQGDDAPAAGRSVADVVESDDVAMQRHRPEEHGGPIHLVNVCLNQTRDDASGQYNADRKGMMLTASSRGIEWGAASFCAISADAAYPSLATWTAVSGAAAAPGAGSYTSSGWAAVMYFLGMRLGYWLRSPLAAHDAGRGVARGWPNRLAWHLLAKPRLLAAEARARYGGTAQPWWYLSDGGHFDNTGVYPLLRRRVDFIVLADGGADPRFEFGDLHNLVRKARIDFGAEIDFYDGADAIARFGIDPRELTVLSPEELASNVSARGVLLARIRYRDEGHGEAFGTLLIVKPNLHATLDADVLGYALRNAAFPQQSTGDQFFDEAQWESYQRLGYDVGCALDTAWLRKLPGWQQPHSAERQARLVRLPKQLPPQANGTEPPFWKRPLPVAAVGTTLGVGALTALLLAAGQGYDQLKREMREREDGIEAVLARAEQHLDQLETAAAARSGAAAPTVAAADADSDKAAGNWQTRTSIRVNELLALDRAVLGEGQQRRLDALVAGYQRHCDDGSNGSLYLCGQSRVARASADAVNYWISRCQVVVGRRLLDEADEPWRHCEDDRAPGAEVPAQYRLARMIRSHWPGSVPGSFVRARASRSAAEVARTRDDPPDRATHGVAAAAPRPENPVDVYSAATIPDASSGSTAPLLLESMEGLAMRYGRIDPRPARAPVDEKDAAAARDGGDAQHPGVEIPFDLQQACAPPFVLFTQAYDEATRAAFTARIDALGLDEAQRRTIAPVENVVVSAERDGRKPPSRWREPTMIVHDDASRPCASALIDAYGSRLFAPDREVRIRTLPKSLRGTRGVIELWLPPGSVSDG